MADPIIIVGPTIMAAIIDRAIITGRRPTITTGLAGAGK